MAGIVAMPAVICATPAQAGRQHNRATMAVAPRARPEDHFTPEQWRRLSAKSSWRGLWLVAFVFAGFLIGLYNLIF